MGFNYILTLFCLLNFQKFLTAKYTDLHQTGLSTYIVKVDVQPDDLESWYGSVLRINPETTSTSQPQILYHYRHVFSGFAAKLSENDVEALRLKNGFISASRERVHSLHTTHSPDFLGLNQNSGFWKRSNYGEGVIIGVIDSGITPDHPSFRDEGLPPPPARWKGKCEFHPTEHACNNKIIGARFFFGGRMTPWDERGHGTHTSSTAAGNFVRGANIFGNANGTASGIAPRAHLSVYKVCDTSGCPESDIVAALDAAIDDGVDIISMSLGPESLPYFEDNIAIGAYRAIQKGIFVSCSAGNMGPAYRTLANEAPWILTVGASTIDRHLRATATLGDNEELDGESAFQPKNFRSAKLELVDGKCCHRKLESSYIKGKIVLCYEDESGLIPNVYIGQQVKNAGGVAMILVNLESRWNNTLHAEAHVLPATQISYTDGLKVQAYLSSTPNPTATISFKGTIIGDDRAPVVAGFSSRGPSMTSPGILKPDIIGPGVNILAAWHLSIENKTETRSNFYILSGTSMSCPHLSGVAALLKSAHPNWSTAAIKSAIMTTADQVNHGGDPIEDQSWSPADIFATGSGHVNPSRANDPGLVYDIRPDDYIPYLCGLNYTSRQVGVIVQRNVDCAKETSIPQAQLNYPSFSIVLGSAPQIYSRTVTNVGEPDSTYDVKIVAPVGVNVTVNPVRLRFSKLNQKLEYNVTFIRSVGRDGYAQGFISWKSANRSVRSPIAIAFE